MAVEISLDAIEKLTHVSEEIRLRALEQIESKFVRALSHQLKILFKPTELCKQLIRWFTYKSSPEYNKKVLQLLERLLESCYGEEVYKKLGVSRIKTELNKVQKLLQESPQEQQIIKRIHKILFEYERRSSDLQSDSDLIIAVETLSITSSEGSESEIPGCVPEDYEIVWSKPTVSDYNSLKNMGERLANNSTIEEKVQVLQHLQITMPDYPAEYMLQSPHLFAKLLQLFENCEGYEKLFLENVSAAVLSFLRRLKECLLKRHRIDSYAVQKKTFNNAFNHIGLLSKTQLKVSKAMELLLDKCLTQLETHTVNIRKATIQVMETIKAVLDIIKTQHLSIASHFFTRVDGIRTQLQNFCKTEECHITLLRTKHVWCTYILLEIAEINADRSQLVDQYKLLVPQMLDFSLNLHFPKLCERNKKVVFSANTTLEQSYKQVEALRTQLVLAIHILKKAPKDPARGIIRFATIVPILDILKSLNLTKTLFSAILAAIPLYLTEHQVKNEATSLLLNLMRLRTVSLKSYVYQNMAIAVKKHFAALMNNEVLCNGVQNQQLLSAQIIGVPFDVNVLKQLTYDSFESDCAELRKDAEDIILLLLRCHHFYETDWKSFLEIFSPILPILQCCTHSQPIWDLLLKLLDPDSKLFPIIDFLRGNIGFMFVDDISVRNEALPRLIYILNSLPYSSDYVPNIIEISDVLPNDLCILQTPYDFQKIFIAGESCYELTTLRNLLKLLDTPDIDPQIRKSTLMQLNIMCKSWEIVSAFCEEQAHCLILASLENSLKKESSSEYIENVIPSISILAKILICDKNFRHELAVIPNVYVLLLRALFYYSHDVQLRQDTSICLFLLVFGNYLIVPPGGGNVEAPKLIGNLKVPLKCKFKSMEYPDLSVIPDILKNFFIDETECKAYISQVIAHSYFEPGFSKKEIEQMHLSLDICPSLLIGQLEARFNKATSCLQNMRVVMKSISNATDQKTLIKTVSTLRLQLMIHELEYNTLAELPLEVTNGIFTLLNKYLQIIPGNAADFQVYACVLDILHFCVNLSSLPIIRQLKSMLRNDFHNGVIIMLKNSVLPLETYLQLNEFLAAILRANSNETHDADQVFQSNFFELLHDITLQFYVSRSLLRIRCSLIVLKALTNFRLKLPEKILHKCCKSIIKLSNNVKSSTQTGSQMHRDCLLSFMQIFRQLPAVLKMNISENFLTYMVGLCGHMDMEVRALSWICLTEFVKIKQPSNASTKSTEINGMLLVTSSLSKLPGEFIGCCLSTFLDTYETLLVRHFAGNLFVMLLNESRDIEKATLLLEKNLFFDCAFNSLETCIFERTMPLHALQTFSEHAAKNEVATCETVICYCRICIAVIKLQPGIVNELCEKPLLFKFSEILKLPMVPSNIAHYEMCAQICCLYAMCSEDNFIFLQRTVCRDDRWLSCFFDLLNPPPNASDESIVCVLQLSLALCRDEFFMQRFCAKLTKSADALRQLFQRAITISRIGCPLQRSVLAVLSYLLIKSQHESTSEEIKNNFLSALEMEYELPSHDPQTDNYSFAETDKENIFEGSNSKGMNQKRKCESIKMQNKIEKNGKITLSKVILLDLYKIFIHLFPCNSYKFDTPPSATRTQVCETLSLLLKQSSNARLAASNLKLLNKILLVLDSFLREFGNYGTTFIQRHGEAKKLAIIKNLNMLFQLLLHWFSPSAGVLVDELLCLEVSKIIIKSWPWLEHSLELKLLALQVCSFLSERSLAVCNQFSVLISSYSHSILQLITKTVVAETHKVKISTIIHFAVVAAGLRVMMNCCACTDGRFTLVKEHALDVIDSLHPFNMKSTKIRQELLDHWLQFWELFSRYNEGGQARSLGALCTVINRFAPYSKTRIICLKIVRNLCFTQQNRAMFMVSSEFIYTINEIISQPLSSDLTEPASYEEQFVASVAIWQLISGGIKFMAMLRGTKLSAKLRNLSEKLQVLKEEDSFQFTKLPFAVDLANILEIIFNIFNEN